jgi:hypothetical protein
MQAVAMQTNKLRKKQLLDIGPQGFMRLKAIDMIRILHDPNNHYTQQKIDEIVSKSVFLQNILNELKLNNSLIVNTSNIINNINNINNNNSNNNNSNNNINNNSNNIIINNNSNNNINNNNNANI